MRPGGQARCQPGISGRRMRAENRASAAAHSAARGCGTRDCAVDGRDDPVGMGVVGHVSGTRDDVEIDRGEPLRQRPPNAPGSAPSRRHLRGRSRWAVRGRDSAFPSRRHGGLSQFTCRAFERKTGQTERHVRHRYGRRILRASGAGSKVASTLSAIRARGAKAVSMGAASAPPAIVPLTW